MYFVVAGGGEVGFHLAKALLESGHEVMVIENDRRRAVFIEEQNIPESLEWDEQDAVVLHAVARNRLGQVIATARLLPAENGISHIGRVAVHRNLRSGGHGAAVMQALEDVARERGASVVALNAQRSAERFYARLGYVPHGDGFEEAGIPHIEMRRPLRSSSSPQ